jgi:hypothetical protein
LGGLSGPTARPVPAAFVRLRVAFRSRFGHWADALARERPTRMRRSSGGVKPTNLIYYLDNLSVWSKH